MTTPVTWRKLAPEEAEALVKGKPSGERAAIAEEYRTNLATFAVGDFVEITIPEDQKRSTVKNRLNRAASEVGYRLNFRRSDQNHLLFQVMLPEQEREPEPAAEPAPTRRGGRRKKQQEDTPETETAPV